MLSRDVSFGFCSWELLALCGFAVLRNPHLRRLLFLLTEFTLYISEDYLGTFLVFLVYKTHGCFRVSVHKEREPILSFFGHDRTFTHYFIIFFRRNSLQIPGSQAPKNPVPITTFYEMIIKKCVNTPSREIFYHIMKTKSFQQIRNIECQKNYCARGSCK